MLVATTTQIDAQGRDGSFMKLFRYLISGANESDKKISMTTPVFMESDKADSAVQMGFLKPKEVAVEGVPLPTRPEVDVRRRAFRGPRFLRRTQRQTRQRVRSQALSLDRNREPRRLRLAPTSDNTGSGVETASCDPPFTPGPLRRNEVLIRLK